MLQIKDLSFTIGTRQLLSGVSWIINPGRRIALIGPNGAGKTTLLKILYGDLEADEGEMTFPKGYQIGLLRQEEPAVELGSILTCVLQGHQEVVDIETEMEQVHRDLEAGDGDQEGLLQKLDVLQDKFQRLGGYRLEADAKAILSGLGFSENDFSRPMGDFSGGWRMRVHLARLLLQSPDLLLLDEPTNHLDIESLEWLEQYLRSFPGSIVLVSHDRFFIDRLAQEICELDRGKLTQYTGNYHDFEIQKAANEALLRKRYEEQKEERERIQRFIDRFRYKASKASQVQSRVKQLEKMEIIDVPPPARRMSFNIFVANSSYKDVLKIDNMSFTYDQDWVLQDVNLSIFRGQKIALVGINGAGKTTLTRLISQQLIPQQGRVELGERVAIGYYAQHQVDTLNLDRTILAEVGETAAETHRARLRDILGIFQFSNDDPEKKIRVLSGGEKARVSLAKMLLSPVNFLIMDEPTNHLDIASRTALEQALQVYDGTLLLISHDRYFLDKLVTRVIEIKDGHLKEFEGNYTDYLARREALSAAAPAPAATTVTETDNASTPRKVKTKEQKRQEAEARQAVSKQRNQLKKEIETCEGRISELESRKGEIEAKMADPATYQDGERAAALQREYAEVKSALESTFARWEEAQVAYEALLEGLEKDN
ncbi:MAG: ABC-F family ATP-binding cassette domain-containing protein [Calditrichaeota bacterium]|nr:ABC-F family ATP-binding cassette domain-containing protein [Calditrichota bacterium]MCB9089018.1 ABC-F family ATP-binding cassette domain-containing protein [Calditrichia bacterium]